MCKFIHGHSRDGYRFTAAYEPVDNGVEVAVAVASKKDNFSRKIGRLISEGRLNKNPNNHFVPNEVLEHRAKYIDLALRNYLETLGFNTLKRFVEESRIPSEDL